MGANAKGKGNRGETEALKLLNGIVNAARERWELPLLGELDQVFFKNRDQVANGGHDILNDLGLAVEVKRQEVLNINTWWNQTLKSANRRNQRPVLMFRQNNRKWRIVLLMTIPDFLSGHAIGPVRGEINLEDFSKWLEIYYGNFLKSL